MNLDEDEKLSAPKSKATEAKKYKCIRTCYINGFLYKVGEVVTGKAPCEEYFVEIK